jgi:hypothetical protein
MSDPSPETPSPEIDFEHAEIADGGQGVACATCRQPIATEYWQFLDKILCEGCRDQVGRAESAARGGAALGKSLLRGGAVAFGCGVAYAIFVGVTSIQFALITIGIGWAVGTAIQKVTGGFGTRRHQVLAVALTYFASSMGYLPAIFKGLSQSAATHQVEGAPASTATAAPSPTSAPADAPPAAPTPASAPREQGGGVGFALLVLTVFSVVFMLAAPIIEITSGFSGILGALIIFFGLQTAWRTSRGVGARLTGPYRVDRPGSA